MGATAVKSLVAVHEVCGFLLLACWLGFVLINAVGGNGHHYRIRRQGWLDRAAKQTRFYLFGIMQGEEHPFPATTQSKFNPLQQVAYVGVMYGLLPLLLLTGLLCLYPQAVGDMFPGVRYWLLQAHFALAFRVEFYSKLACDTKTGRRLYTFCMCPGGTVVPSQTQEGMVCTNGMSVRSRDAANSNSAILVPVDSNDYGPGTLDGMYYQEELEKKAYIAGGSNGFAPAVRYGDLVNGKVTDKFGKVVPSYKPGVRPADFSTIFPEAVLDTLKDGVAEMGRKIKGFDSPDAVLTAVETRSSSPVRILRDRETYQSINVPGIFPCGEGAGYAGGIMSSAIDGINCANALALALINGAK